MGRILFSNVRVLDRTGESPFDGCVLVEGDRLADVTVLQKRERLRLVMQGGVVSGGRDRPADGESG